MRLGYGGAPTDAMVAVCQTRAHEEFGWWNGAGWRPGNGWVVWTVREWVWILGLRRMGCEWVRALSRNGQAGTLRTG